MWPIWKPVRLEHLHLSLLVHPSRVHSFGNKLHRNQQDIFSHRCARGWSASLIDFKPIWLNVQYFDGKVASWDSQDYTDLPWIIWLPINAAFLLFSHHCFSFNDPVIFRLCYQGWVVQIGWHNTFSKFLREHFQHRFVCYGTPLCIHNGNPCALQKILECVWRTQS